MKKLALYTTSFALAIGVTFAIGAGAPVQNIFQGGQPASATAVNQNFQELADRIDTIPGSTTYDYRNYLSTASSMTYNVITDTGGCSGYDTEVRTFVRTPNGANTDVKMTRTRYVGGTGGTVCTNSQAFLYTNSPTKRTLNSREDYTNNALTQTTRIENPVTLRTSSMSNGQTLADASKTFETPAGGVESFYNIVVISSSVAGSEDITVSGISYSGCLKMHSLRKSARFGDTSRLQWLCPGVGEVKRIDAEAGGYTIFELVSTTP